MDEIIFRINCQNIFKEKDIAYNKKNGGFANVILLSKDYYNILKDDYEFQGKDTTDFRARGIPIVMLKGVDKTVIFTEIDKKQLDKVINCV